MLTWFLANVLDRDIGRLNITILFGFSPRLPFPDNYAAFKSVVDKARAIADSDQRTRPLKVAGAEAGPMERLLAFASQPDSAVDIVRVGMEDTPYILDPSGVLLPATNLLLAQEAVRQIEMNRARVNRPI